MRNKKQVIYVAGVIFLLAIILLIRCFYIRAFSEERTYKYEIQFAYPVTSINPSISDDWESGFIVNHIYYRLLPEENNPLVPYLTEKLFITCANPKSSNLTNSCKQIKILFKPRQFSDCMGRSYDVTDILNELKLILTKKGWLVPSWKICSKDKNTICLTGKYIPDQYRRMQSVDLRFGWSKAVKDDQIYGAGPYCLYPKFGLDGNINSGILKPLNKKFNFPIIGFHTSQKKEDHFQVALYGNNSLLTANRKNIQVHTPLAYYVITHPRLDKYKLPWNTQQTRKIIHDFLTENEIFYVDIPKFIKFSPDGEALQTINKQKFSHQLLFAVPNYLPGCKNLVEVLNSHWKGTRTKAVCTDIVDYVNKNVIEKKKNWDGFLVGISASDPSRESLRYQYFSTDSPSSWTYNYLNPDKLFYRVGIGQSLATVDGYKICDIRPNPLGLSNIFITDLIPCKKLFKR